MGQRIKVTVTGFYTPVDGTGYEGVEWPPNSGQFRDLTLMEDRAAYDQHQVEEENMGVDEMVDNLEDVKVTCLAVDDPNSPQPGEGENPFTTTGEAVSPDANNV